MNLTQLAGKPQLVKVTLDDAETVKNYGEAIDFWTWDRQPMDVFLKLANAQTENTGAMIEIVRTLILDESGQAIMSGDVTLPTAVLLAAVSKVSEMLGK